MESKRHKPCAHAVKTHTQRKVPPSILQCVWAQSCDAFKTGCALRRAVDARCWVCVRVECHSRASGPMHTLWVQRMVCVSTTCCRSRRVGQIYWNYAAASFMQLIWAPHQSRECGSMRLWGAKTCTIFFWFRNKLCRNSPFAPHECMILYHNSRWLNYGNGHSFN